MTARMLTIHALSPIHIGTGQGAGVIDLPLIREAVTGWPYLPGSSIKGVLRDVCRERVGVTSPLLKETFGPETSGNPAEHAGGVIVGDQHLLCLPVRSYAGGFAWVTCPFAINRWVRDQQAVRLTPGATALDAQFAEEKVALTSGSALRPQPSASTIYLEDLELTTTNSDIASQATAIAAAAFADVPWQSFFTAHFAVVSNTTFGFLSRTAMEVVARNSIDDDRKVVSGSALWWEELVPAEAIFAGPVITTPQGETRVAKLQAGTDGATEMFNLIDGSLTGRTLQVGGKATVGRGMAIGRLGGAA